MAQLLNLNQLDFLLRLGCEEETVDLLGTKFMFRTLSVEDTTESFASSIKQTTEDGVPRLNALRLEVLSRAIVRINDLPITDTFRDRFKDKLKKMQQIALAKLFDEYQKLAKRQEDKFKTEDEDLEAQVPAQVSSASVVSITPQEEPETPSAEKMVKPSPKTDEPVNIINPQNILSPRK